MSFTQADVDEAFKLFDKNGDGTISGCELKAALASVGQCHSDEEILQLIKAADVDASGSLSKQEFKKVLIEGDPNIKEIKEAFKAFDSDGSGFITHDELKKAMKDTGVKLSDPEIDEMIAAADTDRDGKVNFEEFKKMMCGA